MNSAVYCLILFNNFLLRTSQTEQRPRVACNPFFRRLCVSAWLQCRFRQSKTPNQMLTVTCTQALDSKVGSQINAEQNKSAHELLIQAVPPTRSRTLGVVAATSRTPSSDTDRDSRLQASSPTPTAPQEPLIFSPGLGSRSIFRPSIRPEIRPPQNPPVRPTQCFCSSDE